MLKAHLKLEGEYKCRVYNRDGTLLRTLGPEKNFITSTGLSFPYIYAFADCFQYVSLGEGTAKNSIGTPTDLGTVGLETPIPEFGYIGGRRIKEDVGHAETNYGDAGFSEISSGVSLYRGWRIPIGDTNYFSSAYSFKEVMLSPGRPPNTGYNYYTLDNGTPSTNPTNGDTFIIDNSKNWITNIYQGKDVQVVGDSLSQFRTITNNTATRLNFSSPLETDANCSYVVLNRYSLCHCDEYERDYYTTDNVYGPDNAAIAAYTTTLKSPICNATRAFVRIRSDIDVQPNEFLIFDYTLNIGFVTGRTDFSISPDNGRGVKSSPGVWYGQNEVGSHNIIHHGVKLINPGVMQAVAPWGTVMNQIENFVTDYDYGESFIGPFGSPLEPSTSSGYLATYLSTDNLQFVANGISGGAWADGPLSFEQNNGLMTWRSDTYKSAIGGFNPRFYNIRSGHQDGTTTYWPQPDDYTTEASSIAGFDVDAALPTRPPAIIRPAYDHSTRTRSLSRNFQFVGPFLPSRFLRKPVRSIVLSYQVPGYYRNYRIPYFDLIFSDHDGNIVPPHTYPTYDTSIFTTWSYIESDAQLTLEFEESWSAPCPADVDGC